MKYAEMTSKWLRPCFTRPRRYSHAAEYLLCYDNFCPPPCFKSSLCSHIKRRPQSAPSNSKYPYLSLIDIRKTLTLSIASIPVVEDRPVHIYHMSQLNNTGIFKVDHLPSTHNEVTNCTFEQKSPRLPLQHEKVLAMLDNCDDHTSLLSRMEGLRQYFPLTLTTMAAGTTESLLLSAKASSYTGTSSSSGSNNPTIGMSLSGMIKQPYLQVKASSPVDIYQNTGESVSTHNKVSIDSNDNESMNVSITRKQTSSFHISDANSCANVALLSNSLTNDIKSDHCAQASNWKRDDCIDSMPNITINCQKSTPSSLLMNFTPGTDRLDILSEYKKESTTRSELLRRPGKNILSLLSDKIYMGDPYHLLILVRDTSRASSLRHPLLKAHTPPEVRIFPCYWEGTVENRTAARVVVSINGYQLKLIIPPSPSIYEKFTKNFDLVCSVQFNRTAQLISNTSYYTHIWRLKAIESISELDDNKESINNTDHSTVSVSKIAGKLSLQTSRAASIPFSNRSSFLNHLNQQDVQLGINTDTLSLNTSTQLSHQSSNQSPFTGQASDVSNSSPDCEPQDTKLNTQQDYSKLSSILNFSTFSPDSLSPLTISVSAPTQSTSTSDYDTPINLNDLFRKPLRSTECLKKHSLRQLSQIAFTNSQSFTKVPSMSQQVAASSLGPSLLSSTRSLPTFKNSHHKSESTNRYAQRRDIMFKVAYEMGLRRKG